MLCDTLASKLTNAGKTLVATICYICARNIDKTVEIWSRNLTTEQEGKSYVDLLQVSFGTCMINFEHIVLNLLLAKIVCMFST